MPPLPAEERGTAGEVWAAFVVIGDIVKFRGGYEPRGCTRSPYIVRIIRRSKNRLGGDFLKKV